MLKMKITGSDIFQNYVTKKFKIYNRFQLIVKNNFSN